MAKSIEIYLDADACPVKPEAYRVADRHGLKVFVVANAPIATPRDPNVERIVVGPGADEADDWIADRAGRGDIVITADVPLASRSVKAGALAIGPDGRAFTADAIGMAVAMRDLLTDLRSSGGMTRGPRPFSPRDRSQFLSALHLAVEQLKREGFGEFPEIGTASPDG